jgi:hypothetical protein
MALTLPASALIKLPNNLPNDPLPVTAQPALLEALRRESDHPDIGMSSGWAFDSDAWNVRVWCGACERHEKMSISGREIMLFHDDTRRLIEKAVVPFLANFARDICISVVSQAELAEWLTWVIAKAGPAGERYATLIHAAVKYRKATPQGVDAMLRRMGFLEEWTPARIVPILPDHVHVAEVEGRTIDNPRIVLPEGHPLRRW